MSKRGQVFQLALVGLLQSLDKAGIVSNKAAGRLDLLWCSELAVFLPPRPCSRGGLVQKGEPAFCCPLCSAASEVIS